ncbi:hypothetical protein SAMN06296386_104320 [Lachnospiraceae bacterium]|nr:hypothetical protein SAMN06296386_104320 [Lachnospiraceae bacterium]
MNEKKKKSVSIGRALLFFAFLMVILLLSVEYTKKGSVERQKESLERAIQRDITYCYATTGSYPKTLDYIERVYGLTYDEEVFTIDYEVRGSKIPPIVTVRQTGEE